MSKTICRTSSLPRGGEPLLRFTIPLPIGAEILFVQLTESKMPLLWYMGDEGAEMKPIDFLCVPTYKPFDVTGWRYIGSQPDVSIGCHYFVREKGAGPIDESIPTLEQVRAARKPIEVRSSRYSLEDLKR
jgi:hypothetical protein